MSKVIDSRFFRTVAFPFALAILIFVVVSAMFFGISHVMGSKAKAYAAESMTGQHWNTVVENMGILYFYKPDCSYCKQQKVILEDLQQKTGFQNVISINTNERTDLAMQYGVSTVPDVWIVGQVGEEVKQRRISIGLINQQEVFQMLEETYRFWFLSNSEPG